MQQTDIDTLHSQKSASGAVLLTLETAQLVGGIINNTYFVSIQGEKPWTTMEVTLVPYIYVRQPEYWGIQVVGIQRGIGLPTTAPFTHVEEVSSYIGTKGIELIGNNTTIKLEL